MVEGFDYEPTPIMKPFAKADQKAAEAAADVPELTPVERFVASATETNFHLFSKAVDEAVDQVQSCFNDQWIPEGDAAELMLRMDHAVNFLRLAETYFRALSTPLMQAGSIYLEQQRVSAAMAPVEPPATQRGFIPGSRVYCRSAKKQGIIMEFDSDNLEFLVKHDDGTSEWHKDCLELVK